MTALMSALRPDPTTIPPTHWAAELALRFGRRGDDTVLTHSRHEGPLRIQKALYPEGRDLCHAILLHPPAGIAGGDRLQIDVSLDADARALLTTPGAGKWYRSAGLLAEQTVNLNVGPGATLEWLPQESIVFDGAQARMRTRVELAQGACYLGVETLCFGRRASGETFSRGAIQLTTDIRLDGQALWLERGRVEGGSALLDSPVGLARFNVCSTVIAAGMDFDADIVAACRQANAAEAGAQWGVTTMPKLLVCRYLGHSAEAARLWFVDLWRCLRPVLIGREMTVPRIWNT